ENSTQLIFCISTCSPWHFIDIYLSPSSCFPRAISISFAMRFSTAAFLGLTTTAAAAAAAAVAPTVDKSNTPFKNLDIANRDTDVPGKQVRHVSAKFMDIRSKSSGIEGAIIKKSNPVTEKSANSLKSRKPKRGAVRYRVGNKSALESRSAALQTVDSTASSADERSTNNDAESADSDTDNNGANNGGNTTGGISDSADSDNNDSKDRIANKPSPVTRRLNARALRLARRPTLDYDITDGEDSAATGDEQETSKSRKARRKAKDVRRIVVRSSGGDVVVKRKGAGGNGSTTTVTGEAAGEDGFTGDDESGGN
ncbi:hypothetical protein K504DRAFT_511850, partial [Pleomassaria siparia CBS 279.74]